MGKAAKGIVKGRQHAPAKRAGGGAGITAGQSAPAGPVTVKVRKYGPVGAFLRPVGIGVALLLCAYGLVSLGSTFWRSWQRHQEYTVAAHEDRSVFDIILEPALPADAVDLVVRDVDGTLRKVVASGAEADRFVNETILMLDGERDRIKRQAREDIDAIFAHAFADRSQAIEGYADWFFEWKRSYIVLKETFSSAAARFAQTGEYENLTEAVERDLKDYFMRHYKAQVLKPELRDQVITQGLERSVRHAHDSYRRVIANGDMRLQLSDVPADAKMTDVRLDWDAQKWKAPVYLMEDRALDAMAGVGYAAAGGTFGALALGPAVNRIMARSFGLLSRRFVTAFGARLALAEQGAAAGTIVEPGGGTVVGAITGILVGAAADYFVNKADEHFNRDQFIAANEEALDATIDVWKSKLLASMDAGIDRWFDDARASVVLARK
jgi:hypothetical protein